MLNAERLSRHLWDHDALRDSTRKSGVTIYNDDGDDDDDDDADADADDGSDRGGSENHDIFASTPSIDRSAHQR